MKHINLHIFVMAVFLVSCSNSEKKEVLRNLFLHVVKQDHICKTEELETIVEDLTHLYYMGGERAKDKVIFDSTMEFVSIAKDLIEILNVPHQINNKEELNETYGRYRNWLVNANNKVKIQSAIPNEFFNFFMRNKEIKMDFKNPYAVEEFKNRVLLLTIKIINFNVQRVGVDCRGWASLEALAVPEKLVVKNGERYFVDICLIVDDPYMRKKVFFEDTVVYPYYTNLIPINLMGQSKGNAPGEMKEISFDMYSGWGSGKMKDTTITVKKKVFVKNFE